MSKTIAEKKNVRRRSSRVTPLKAQVPTARRADIHPLDRAIAELRSELARSPDDPTLLGRLGALFYRRGDLAEAETFYRRAIALAPGRPNLHNNLGNVLCDLGRMRDGIAAYEHAMAVEKALNPERAASPEAVANLEMARMEFRLVHERIEYLERASQLDVSSAEALNTLGCGYLLRGERQRALVTFRKAAAMNPRNCFAGMNIAFAHSLNLRGSDDLKTAMAEVAESIIRFPHEGRLHIHQAELLENAGLLGDAEERYLRALQADPRCHEAYELWRRLHEVTGGRGTHNDGTRIIEQTLQKLEESARKSHENLGAAVGAGSIFDLALVQWVRIQSGVALPAATNERVFSGTGMQQVDALLREAALAEKTEGKISGPAADQGNVKNVAVRAAILRARLFETDGRANEARLVLEQASAADAESARLWFERGSFAMRGGDVAEALTCFDRATLCEPQDALQYHSLRFAFEGYRRYRTERIRFETATKANPRDASAHYQMALAAHSVLKNEESLFHFTRALELDPRLSDAACGRGRALQRLGQLDEAEAAYAKALEIDPENIEAHRSVLSLRAQRTLPPK